MTSRGLAGRLLEWKLIGRALADRVGVRFVRLGRTARAFVEPAADRLLIAPQDLRTADPTVATDIYAGVFVFSGQIVECNGRSPFEMPPPGEEWARVLHGFGWLRHLRAADTPIARSNARILVDDWLRIADHPPIAWEPEVVARRTMAWLAQSPMILADADQGFYHRFLAGMTRQFRWLRTRWGEEPTGLPRLKVAIAVLATAIAVDGFRRHIKAASRRLDDELKRQILPDGGHVGRNPVTILEVLIDLLPIRQALAARGHPVSPVMMGAIDRMMPMLRFFRHADGAFALFNGATTTPTDLVATVLAYDDAQGRPHGNAPHSGYQRLEAEKTVVVMDCGTPPPPEFARAAHAGTLAFELSSANARFVVNCGAPFRPVRDWRRIARSTAAHSTLVVDDHSSAVVREAGLLADLLGPVLLHGPTDVPVDRTEADGAVAVTASHDGFAAEFGVVHERTLKLSAAGDALEGRDRVVPFEGGGADAPFVVRFHLHPSVKVGRLGEHGVVLIGHAGEGWEFHCDDAVPEIEESVHLADLHGLRRTSQIVLTSGEGGPREIRWRFLRTARSHARGR
ncbi:MAG: heparinase II/III family protein [Siculibacillus sp.]|nr:heparinase II/III family protein [Siculibacillus sp.]